MREMGYTQGWHDVRDKPSGKFEARWADENGLARGKSFLTKRQAQKYAAAKATGILDASLGLCVSVKNMQEAVDDFLLRRIAAGSTAIYERHLNDFMTTMSPSVKTVGNITRAVIERYDAILETRGHNPGGRRHIWKSLKTFCRHCIRNKWLAEYPFMDLKAPKSEFEGRALTPMEFDRMISVDPRFPVDVDINRALRIGNPSMLRISQVWKLTPEDFREPGELRIEGIKGQESVWTPLHPLALAVVRILLGVTAPSARFFARWPTVDSMRQSLRKKANRVHLHGVRFHDAGKVSRVSELDAAGWGLGALSELSNTSRQTLSKHYIKADRRKAFAEYQKFQSGIEEKVYGKNFPGPESIGLPPADLPQTGKGPETGMNRSETNPLEPTRPNNADLQNASNL